MKSWVFFLDLGLLLLQRSQIFRPFSRLYTTVFILWQGVSSVHFPCLTPNLILNISDLARLQMSAKCPLMSGILWHIIGCRVMIIWLLAWSWAHDVYIPFLRSDMKSTSGFYFKVNWCHYTWKFHQFSFINHPRHY